MVHCVLGVGKVQLNVIFLWWGMGKGSVMLYCEVRVWKGQFNGILCVESWEMAA
jgi:hypothetical protein